MTKLNKTHMGVAGDGTSYVAIDDTGKWGAPTAANHYRFINASHDSTDYLADNIEMHYKGPFKDDKGSYRETFADDDPAWKFQKTIDSCEGATNDGQVPGPTLGSDFIWKLWFSDQTLLDEVSTGEWSPSWYIQILDPNNVSASGTTAVLRTFEDESDANGSAASGERCISISVSTAMWFKDPMNRDWGVFPSSFDEPKLDLKLWQKLPWMNSVYDAYAFWGTPSHEETIYLRDPVIPHMVKITKNGNIQTDADVLGMDQTYQLQHRYFGPAREANFKVGTSIFQEPGDANSQDFMDRYWMSGGNRFNLSFINGEEHHFEWDTAEHATLYNESGAHAVTNEQDWVIPGIATGEWPWYYSTPTGGSYPYYFLGGGTVDPTSGSYNESVLPYGADKNFEPVEFGYKARRRWTATQPKEFEISNSVDGTKIFKEGETLKFNVKMKGFLRGTDDLGNEPFRVQLNNLPLFTGFGPEDIDWSNTTTASAENTAPGWWNTTYPYMILNWSDVDDTTYPGYGFWQSEDIVFAHDYEMNETTLEGDPYSVISGGEDDVRVGLFYINGSNYVFDDLISIITNNNFAQEQSFSIDDVDLGKTMPAAAFGLNLGDPVKSVYMAAGYLNNMNFDYVGFNQTWWDNQPAGLQPPLVRDEEVRFEIRRINTSDSDVIPAYASVTWPVPGSVTLNLGADANYDVNPDNKVVNQKGQYDDLANPDKQLFLIAKTGTGAYEATLGVWMIEPLYPAFSGNMLTVGLTPENLNYSDRTLVLSFKNRDGNVPDTDDWEVTNILEGTATHPSNLYCYINVDPSNTTHAVLEDFDSNQIFLDDTFVYNEHHYFKLYNDFSTRVSTSGEIVYTFPNDLFVDDDPVEGRQFFTIDFSIGRRDFTVDDTKPVDHNGVVQDTKLYTLQDDYLYSDINVTFERINTASDYGDVWPHAGQAAPDLEYPNQSSTMSSTALYHGQGVKITVDMSNASIPVGTKVAFIWEPPSGQNILTGWESYDVGLLKKTFEKTDQESTFVEVVRPDLSGTTGMSYQTLPWSAEIATEVSLSNFKDIATGTYEWIYPDNWSPGMQLREYTDSGVPGTVVVHGDFPHAISEANIDDGVWNKFYATFCLNDSDQGLNNLSGPPWNAAPGATIPSFLVFDDATFTADSPNHKDITLDVSKADGVEIKTIDGKSGILVNLKQGQDYTDASVLWDSPNTDEAWIASAYGEISSDSDSFQSTISATLYVGVDENTTNLNKALFTYTFNIITASEVFVETVTLSNDEFPWLFNSTKTLSLLNNTDSPKNFYIVVVDHSDSIFAPYQPKTITVPAFTTVTHAIDMENANKIGPVNDDMLVMVFGEFPTLSSFTRVGLVNIIINQSHDILYAEEIPFKTGTFTFKSPLPPYRGPSSGGIVADADWYYDPYFHDFPTSGDPEINEIYFNTTFNFGTLSMSFYSHDIDDTALAEIDAQWEADNERYTFELPDTWSTTETYGLLNPYLGTYPSNSIGTGTIFGGAPLNADTTLEGTLWEDKTVSNGVENTSNNVLGNSTHYYTFSAIKTAKEWGYDFVKARVRVNVLSGTVTTTNDNTTVIEKQWVDNLRDGESTYNLNGVYHPAQYVIEHSGSFEITSATVGSAYDIYFEVYDPNDGTYQVVATTPVKTIVAPPGQTGDLTHNWAEFAHAGTAEGGSSSNLAFNENTILYASIAGGEDITKTASGDRYVVIQYVLRDWSPNNVSHDFAILLANGTWKTIDTHPGSVVANTSYNMGTVTYGLVNEEIDVDANDRVSIKCLPDGNNDNAYNGGIQLAAHFIDNVSNVIQKHTQTFTPSSVGGLTNLDINHQYDTVGPYNTADSRALRLFIGANSNNNTGHPSTEFPSSLWRTNKYSGSNNAINWWDNGTSEYGMLGFLWDDVLDDRTELFNTSTMSAGNGNAVQITSIEFS